MIRLRKELASLSASQRAEAVRAFNTRFGEMERALWCLSRHCRPVLVDGHSDAAVEALVWTLKSWWGVQGVRTETKTLMAEALVFAVDWTPDLGVPRREFSLASKVLHWLLPWRVPVYDSFVRSYLGVPSAWDHPQAYRRVVRDVFAITSDLGQDLSWAGSVAPLSPLHALDKCLWWLGGGNTGTAVVVKDPWRVVDHLGLERG